MIQGVQYIEITAWDGSPLRVQKHDLWEWLKAERRYRPPKEKLQQRPNRAARRRMGLKRIF